jgi:hypothetical protein
MFTFGLTYRLLIEMYVHPGMGLAALVGGVSVSSKLLDVGSAASMVFGGIPCSIAFIALIHLLMEAAEVETQERDIWQRDSWQRAIASLLGLKTRRGLGASYPRHVR